MELLTLHPHVRLIPLRFRMFVALFLPFVELILLIAAPAAKLPSQKSAMVLIILVGIIGGFSKALCDSTINALSAPFPTKFMNGELWGLTISSLFMSVLQCILKASFGTTFHDNMTMSRVYFGIAIGFQVLTLIQFCLLSKNPYSHKYIAEFRALSNKTAEDVYNVEPYTNNHSNTTEATEDVHVLELEGASHRRESDVAADANVRSVKEVDAEIQTFGNAAVLKVSGDADNMYDRDQVGLITSS
uniref:Uncharacterized protein n=1 Tax=Lygus hesperus TaxID=30085 RepID=A0A0A9YEZ7_LYGHE